MRVVVTTLCSSIILATFGPAETINSVGWDWVTKIERRIPEKIDNLPPITSLSAGDGFSLFLDENGSVWSCGRNDHGQLGLGDTNNRNIPELIKNLPKIKSVFTLGFASLFLDSEGSVWSVGDNRYGQLGLGSEADNLPKNARKGYRTSKNHFNFRRNLSHPHS